MHTSLLKCTVLGLALSGTVLAQQTTVTTTVEESKNRYSVMTNRFFDNWFVGLGGGAQIYFGDNDSKLKLSERVKPAANIYVGKWFTPGFGLRLGFDVGEAKGLTENHWLGAPNAWYVNYYSTGKTQSIDGKTYYEQKIRYGHLNAHAMFNLSNMLCGYSEKRFYNLIPYAGVGYMMSEQKGNTSEEELSAVAGIYNTFRLGNALNLTLDVKGTLVGREFSHKRPLDVNNPAGRDQILSATLGVVYKFRQRDWERSRNTTTVIKYSEEELNTLRSRVNALAKANEELTNQLASGNTKERSQIEKEIAAMPLLVTFPINKSTVSNTARVNLGFLAKIIKENPDVVYTITGYADKGTGTPAINKRLSQARANAVYDVLTKEFGVNPEQLSTAYEGGVGNMFYDDPRVSRAVITIMKKK